MQTFNFFVTQLKVIPKNRLFIKDIKKLNSYLLLKKFILKTINN